MRLLYSKRLPDTLRQVAFCFFHGFPYPFPTLNPFIPFSLFPLRQVHACLACPLGFEDGADGGAAGNGGEGQAAEEVFQLAAGDELDAYAGDVVGGEELGFVGAFAGDL